MPWRGPQFEGELPTLGYLVLDWILEMLAAPDRPEYEPFVPTREQAEFILRFYELHPATGKRRIRRGVLSRPRGWGKSPLLAAIACAEALGPVVPDGWDANGEPVGMGWERIRTPLVQVAAVSEDQTQNTWGPLLEMLRLGPVIDEYPGLEPLDTFVNLPRGKIDQVTSSATSRKGNKALFAVLDQTEEWTPSNGGKRLAQVMRSNAAKIGGTTLESPNAYIPGMGSVAEETAAFAKAIAEGRTREDGLLWDHREAPPETDPTDRESLVAGLRYAYGDSSDHEDGCVLHSPPCPPGWSPIDRLIGDFWDTSNDPQVMRSDFLNQITHASDSWLSQPEWAGCSDAARVVADGDTIVLGFDGSRARARGVTDATALVGCRVSDGHLFLLGCWEQPEGPSGQDWRVPVLEVLASVEEAFSRFRVVGMYADPAKWEGHIADWEARWGSGLQVKATRDHPIEWWMTGGRSNLIVRALEKFHSAVLDRELSHDGSSTLARHVLNARRRKGRSGIQIMKEHPDSARKIDAAIAGVLAWQARLDAVAKGLAEQEEPMGGFTF
ncbi:terminase [Streptomyces europaeiscabiei]|uniref:terminase n=1 Tax=Streptomyces europaeiscabiei TaxID=146819 RepID=UPI0029BB6161|nr:terminase [Streptomyces europaeiscabiei]MDX3713384.1 terminase [Streptomyces europaeiscabiei]